MSDPEQALQKAGGDSAPVRQADFTPRSMQELQQFAETVSQSKMVPKKYRGSPQDIVVAVMHGMELGLPPLQALQSVAVINGRPSIYGDAALAVVRRSGLLADIKETVEGSGKDATAYCTVKRTDTGEVIKQRFSWQEAIEAGLTQKGGPWQDYPRRMLQMRARSWCLRDAFPEVLKGMMLAEEAEAIPQSNGQTIDPKGEMERPNGHTPEIVEWQSPHGQVYEIPPGKKASLQNASEALEKEGGADLGAKIEQIRGAWDWDGKADTALDSLLAYHELRLASQQDQKAEDAATETGEPTPYDGPQDALEAKFDDAWAKGNEGLEPISDAQLNRLYAIADDNDWDEAALNRLVKDELGYESKKDVPYGDPYDEICAALEDERLRYHMGRGPDTPDMFEGNADEGEANHPEFEDPNGDLPF
jgi:hypothetical protein